MQRLVHLSFGRVKPIVDGKKYHSMGKKGGIKDFPNFIPVYMYIYLYTYIYYIYIYITYIYIYYIYITYIYIISFALKSGANGCHMCVSGHKTHLNWLVYV